MKNQFFRTRFRDKKGHTNPCKSVHKSASDALIISNPAEPVFFISESAGGLYQSGRFSNPAYLNAAVMPALRRLSGALAFALRRSGLLAERLRLHGQPAGADAFFIDSSDGYALADEESLFAAVLALHEQLPDAVRLAPAKALGLEALSCRSGGLQPDWFVLTQAHLHLLAGTDKLRSKYGPEIVRTAAALNLTAVPANRQPDVFSYIERRKTG